MRKKEGKKMEKGKVKREEINYVGRNKRKRKSEWKKKEAGESRTGAK